MAKLNYLLSNGKVLELEVSEEFIAGYEEMEKGDAKVERSETRRHQSLNELVSYGFDFEDENMNVERMAIKNIEVEKLRRAIELLEQQQQELIRQIYFENIPLTKIAQDKNIVKSAISNRLEMIKVQLKKFLQKTYITRELLLFPWLYSERVKNF